MEGNGPVTPRANVRRLVDSRRFQHTILAVILVNAVTLGAETSPALVSASGGLITYADRVAVGIFVIELLLKLFAYGLRFFRDPWNCFDLVIVTVSLVPASGAFSVLRAFRVLRVLRVISAVPSMKRVVGTLMAAIPGVSAIIGLLVLLVYVAGVMGTRLFGADTPHHFGDLGTSLWTLFQVMTGEAWPDVAADVMEHQPGAWVFFLVYILVSTFVVLNLFLAVVVNAMDRVQEAEAVDRRDAAQAAGVPPDPDAAATGGELAAVREELAALRRELAALHGALAPPTQRRGDPEPTGPPAT
jgi:voltage-gated sodium channel